MKDNSITFRLDSEAKEQLKSIAARDDITLSKLIYRIVKQYLESRENERV